MLPAGGITQGLIFLFAGSVLVPLLGSRGSLLLGCLAFVLAPLLGYIFLDGPVSILALSYGCLSGAGVNLVIIPLILIPVTWFPDSKGKVVGFISAGFGLSSLVFTPLQTLLINPDNISPVIERGENGSAGAYFESQKVLDRLPNAMLYLAAINATLLLIGFLLCVEKGPTVQRDRKQDLLQFRHSLKYLCKTGLRTREFYILWFTRYSMLTVCSGVLAHWKTFSLELSSDDRLMSIVGGVIGILNALSRLVAGALVDRWAYRYVMPVYGALLCLGLGLLVPLAYASFPGFVALMWLIYFLAFCHFATVPTQVIQIFDRKYSSIILGAIGFSDTIAYGTMAMLNLLFQTREPFLPFFLSLAGFALLTTVVTAFCREMKEQQPTSKSAESLGKENPVYGNHEEVPAVDQEPAALKHRGRGQCNNEVELTQVNNRDSRTIH